MKVVVQQPADEPGWQPLTGPQRSIGRCLLAGRTLAEWQERSLREALAPLPSDLEVLVSAHAWLDPAELAELAALGPGAALRASNGVLLCRLAPSLPESGCLGGRRSLPIRGTWQFLDLQERILAEGVEGRLEGELSPAAHVEGTLVLGRGSRVLPGVFIEGTVIIGENCRIGPNAYLRGGTSIADGCKVGQAVEVKNSILYPGATLGHLSYCGDSIIGAGVNVGAGTITSNYRHDGGPHRTAVEGQLIDTGRRKFGAVIGDGVHTGIHTGIYPGRKLWPGTSTLPGAVVQRDLHPDGGA